MNRKFAALAVATAAVAVAAAPAMGASSGPKKCGNISAKVGNIKATNTTCKVAKEVVRADSKGKKTAGWSCKGKQINTGSMVTCTHKGGKKVTYQTAD